MMDDAEPTPLSSSGLIAVRNTPYTGEANARGVFACCNISRGTLIERSHCLRFTKEEHDLLMQTNLKNYTFCAGGGIYLLALGIGSLFNHHDPPNVEYRIDRTHQIINYMACKDISCGDELCIFYGKKLWFDAGGESKDEADGSSAGEEMPLLPFCGTDDDEEEEANNQSNDAAVVAG